MQQPSIGLSDLTSLECMAIPTKESSEVSAKVEAVLSNIQQRYKKDQIYVSYYLTCATCPLNFFYYVVYSILEAVLQKKIKLPKLKLIFEPFWSILAFTFLL